MMVTKKLDAFGKKMDFGPKNCIFGPKFCIFLRYTYETPIFWLGRTRLNGIITPPYPEGTLDTFGFPVGGRLALLGSKNAVFWLETNSLVVSLKINCYNHDGTPKRPL